MNCIIIDDDPMATKMLSKFIDKHGSLNLVNTFENPLGAIPYIKKENVDLIFLDEEMPEMTGMEFLQAMDGVTIPVILTTSHSELALEAFKYNVTGFLVKPVKFEEFANAIKKLKLTSVNADKLEFEDDYFFVKSGKLIQKINKQDLNLIECIGDYATLYAGNEMFTVHSTMKALENRFPSKDFIRVHRSYIIRIDAIHRIEDDTIVFDEKIIPIGKTYRKGVYNRLNIL